MEQGEKPKVSFDFTTQGGVLKAFQAAAEASANQALPVANVLGIQRSASGAVRLAELELRYRTMEQKHRKEGARAPRVALIQPDEEPVASEGTS